MSKYRALGFKEGLQFPLSEYLQWFYLNSSWKSSLLGPWGANIWKQALYGTFNLRHFTLCWVYSQAAHTYCCPRQQLSPAWHQQPAEEWPIMQFSLCLQRGRLSSLPHLPHPRALQTSKLYTSPTCAYTFPTSECWHMTNQRPNKQLVLNNPPPPPTSTHSRQRIKKINKSLSVWPSQAIW